MKLKKILGALGAFAQIVAVAALTLARLMLTRLTLSLKAKRSAARLKHVLLQAGLPKALAEEVVLDYERRMKRLTSGLSLKYLARFLQETRYH